MDRVVLEAIKQALKFFQGRLNPQDLARGAEKVLEVATKVAPKGR